MSMPFTVITLKKVPPSLRGDLTKWMQEIATGVYVGNFSTRVRQYLWKRVCDSIGDGEATLSFAFRNEIGYSFQTLNADRTVVDFDGIPLVMIPTDNDQVDGDERLHKGFSHAYQMHMGRKAAYPQKQMQADLKKEDSASMDVKNQGGCNDQKDGYVVIDLETTGLHADSDQIIEVGAVKWDGNATSEFHELVNIQHSLPSVIVQLTGITNEMLTSGKDLQTVLQELITFIGKVPIVGYNVGFDIKFLNAALNGCGMSPIENEVIDLLKTVKKEQIFQENYKLETTLKSYGINEQVPHRALEDAKLIFRLSSKVNVFHDIEK